MIDVEARLDAIRYSECGYDWADITRLVCDVAAERDALAAKLANIKDNISLIGELVCPSGHGAIEHPDIDPLMCEYVCKCGDVLYEHTADIAVLNIRTILEVTE